MLLKDSNSKVNFPCKVFSHFTIYLGDCYVVNSIDVTNFDV